MPLGEQRKLLTRTERNSARGPRYLRVSRSKAADVVVDLLEDEAPVHEGEAPLWVNKPRGLILAETHDLQNLDFWILKSFYVPKFIL